MLEFEAVTSVRAHAQWLKTFNGQVNKHILDNPPLSFRPSIHFPQIISKQIGPGWGAKYVFYKCTFIKLFMVN